MAKQTTGSMALCPTVNVRGGNYFVSLKNSQHINFSQWILLLIMAEVVDLFRAFSGRNNALRGITFTHHNYHGIIGLENANYGN